MLKSNDQNITVYKDDYKPVNVYSGRVKIAGYKEEQHSGKTIEVDDTYNDLLDCKVKGHHEQDSRKAYWWNQLVKPNTTPSTKAGVTITFNNDHFVLNGTATESTYLSYFAIKTSNTIQNHKYLCFCKENDASIAWASPNQQLRECGKVIQYTFSFTFNVLKDVIYDNFKLKPVVFDLTAMFGEGKEPTAEEFRKMFPCDYYPYCEGEWRVFDKDNYLDTAFDTPFPEMPEEIRYTENPVINISSDCVLWNQLQDDFTIKITGSSGTVLTKLSNGYKINTPVKLTVNNVYFTKLNLILVGHKYALSVDILSDSDCTALFAVNGNTPGAATTVFFILETIHANIKKRVFGLFDYYTTRYSAPLWYGGATANSNVEITNLNIIDLTKAFGEGNEPLTVEEFRSMFPKDYYPYDEGTLRTKRGLLPVVPKDYTIPFELYGANGINDEVEPCVLVDGEWKCRVTRKWGKLTATSANAYSAIGKRPADDKVIFSVKIPDVKQTYNLKAVCSILKNHNSDLYAEKEHNSFSGWSWGSQIAFDVDEMTFAEFKNWLDQYTPTFIYELAQPVIELYPPIPIRTLPISTIINSDAELDCNIKVVDNS